MATVTAQRKCSMCRQPGHTKRTCPQRTVLPQSAAPAAPSQSSEAPNCPICYEPLGNGTTCTTPCKHEFCMQCLVRHQQTKSTCPLCRADLPGVAPVAPVAPVAAVAPVAPPALRGYAASLAMRAGPGSIFGPPLPGQASRFEIILQNHGSITVDVWWLPGVGLQPALLHRNIAPGTVRRINVGGRGDRFSLARPGPYAPLVEFQANAPNINFVYTGTTLVELD